MLRINHFLWAIFIFFPLQVNALTFEESILKAVENSTEIKIEQKRAELAGASRYDALSTFLPSANLSYRDGKRETEISNSEIQKRDEYNQSLTLTQPLFDGFSGLSKLSESHFNTKSAIENLNYKKNTVAMSVCEAYFNILKYRHITLIEEELIENYQEVSSLAKQRLQLKDISFGEYNDYELRAKRYLFETNQNKLKLKEYELLFINYTKQEATDLSYPKIDDRFNDVENFIEYAKVKNPRIKSLDLAYKAKKAAVAVEAGKLLPRISLNAQYDKQNASYFLNNQNLRNRSIYLNFSIPIFQSGSEYNAISKINKEKQIANLEKKLAIEEIERTTHQEYIKYIDLKQSLLITEELYENSRKSFELLEQRFAKKDIDKIDFLLKKIDLAEIEKQLYNARSDFIISYFRLKFLINEIIKK